MKETIKETLRTIFIIILFFFVVSVIYYIGVGWDDLRASEKNKKREEFCRSFLDRGSILYDRCLESAEDYDIK
jgi:hypothetical protein